MRHKRNWFFILFLWGTVSIMTKKEELNFSFWWENDRLSNLHHTNVQSQLPLEKILTAKLTILLHLYIAISFRCKSFSWLMVLNSPTSMTTLEISLGVWIILKGHCGGNNLVFLFIILKVESFWPFQNLIIISKNRFFF